MSDQKQFGEFVAAVIQSLPETSPDIRQGWIENRKGLQKLLSGLCPPDDVQLLRKKGHIIDCDSSPFVPKGWKVDSHRKGGQLEWNPANVHIYLSEHQKGGKSIEGNKLLKELEGKPVLNANVLDWLLAHQELIPEEWKGKYVFFWGTIYRYSDGYLCVRSLYQFGDRWGWNFVWLGGGFDSGNPAALSASI